MSATVVNEKIIKEVEDLETVTDKEEQVKLLQKIAAKLLNEYIIQVGPLTIEPLLVEAYYCNQKNGFIDKNMHCSEKQKNRFGKLYFHETGRGGIDICFSNGDYYLSLLIKNSLVRKDCEQFFCRQTQLNDLLKKSGFAGTENYVLYKRNKAKSGIVIYTVRKGLVKCDGYKNELLAAVTGFDLKDENKKRYRFDLEKGHTKEYLVFEYLMAHPGELTSAEFKNIFLDYIPKKIRETDGLLK